MSSKTMECQTQGAAPRGWGGRIADAVAKGGLTAESFSLSGVSTFSQGFSTAIEIIDWRSGSVTFKHTSEMQDAIQNVTAQAFDNIYMEEFAQQFRGAIHSSESLSEYLKESKILSGWRPSGRTEYQFYQVARLISTHEKRGTDRDIFYLSNGGWDMHSGLLDKLPALLATVDTAIEKFISEIKAQGEYKNVVIMQMSEFGRTLTHNGHGTDHGWGTNSFLLGGPVNGGRMFNKFLETYNASSEFDAGRGRVIPQYPWESVVAPVAEWLGVEEPATIFKNIGNFGNSHINKKELLFSTK